MPANTSLFFLHFSSLARFSASAAQIWDEPDTFDPERWERPRTNPEIKGWAGYDPNKRAGFYPSEIASDFAFIPFGGGERKCVGDQFATLEVRPLLAPPRRACARGRRGCSIARARRGPSDAALVAARHPRPIPRALRCDVAHPPSGPPVPWPAPPICDPQSLAVLAVLLRRLDISLADPSAFPGMKAAATIHTKEGLMCNVHPRK